MSPVVNSDALPSLLATAVGSLPHEDPCQAVDLVLRTLTRAPHALQLSRIDPREQMWIQFTENVPRFRSDFEQLHYSFDTTGDPGPELEEFFTRYLEVIEGGSPDYFAVGPEYGRGIHAFFDAVAAGGKRYPFLKVQVTGPLSFALTVTDENNKPIFFHDMFRDVAVKAMGLKAVWLMEQCRHMADRIIVFFDEPILSAYGSSAFLGVSRDDAVESLNDVMDMVQQRGALAGVHCCGNTDWGMLMDTNVSIVNFDAVFYLEHIAMYAKELNAFLERGGILAWGAVLNTEDVERETVEDVVRRIRNGVDVIAKNGVDRELLTRNIIVTPACGCAGLTVGQAERVYQILAGIDELGGREIFGR